MQASETGQSQWAWDSWCGLHPRVPGDLAKPGGRDRPTFTLSSGFSETPVRSPGKPFPVGATLSIFFADIFETTAFDADKNNTCIMGASQCFLSFLPLLVEFSPRKASNSPHLPLQTIRNKDICPYKHRSDVERGNSTQK